MKIKTKFFIPTVNIHGVLSLQVQNMNNPDTFNTNRNGTKYFYDIEKRSIMHSINEKSTNTNFFCQFLLYSTLI